MNDAGRKADEIHQAAIVRFQLPNIAAPLDPKADHVANESGVAKQRSELFKQLAAAGF